MSEFLFNHWRDSKKELTTSVTFTGAAAKAVADLRRHCSATCDPVQDVLAEIINLYLDEHKGD